MAEVYPVPRNPLLRLSDEQRELVRLFGSAEFQGELRWQELLTDSQETLEGMAAEALAEYLRGETKSVTCE